MQSKPENLTQPWAAPDATKKKHGLKSDFLVTEMSLDSGILKTSDRNFGTCLTVEKVLENIFAYFPFPIGQKWMFGSTSFRKKSKSHRFIYPTNAWFLSATVC